VADQNAETAIETNSVEQTESSQIVQAETVETQVEVKTEQAV
jgi:hypothetical protein